MSVPNIQMPVIYPTTLTEEQRQIIKRMFAYFEKMGYDDNNAGGHLDAFLWLFGKELFNN